MTKRVFLIVLDSVGIGELPDAERFGDKGANTLKSISISDEFNIPNLLNLGLGNIDGIDYLEKIQNKNSAVGRCAEVSVGKDTTTGHWELAGVVSKTPFPTFENSFPNEVIQEFQQKTGRKVLCNKPYSGTEVIKEYGEEHLKTGDLIVYTSADSVFQIAAHEDKVPVETLYEYCKIAREILKGEYAVGRVIARPFTGDYPFSRTARRHDFSLEPTGTTVLDALKNAGKDVIAVGKINDIFASRGITKSIKTVSNADGMQKTEQLLSNDFSGLCFVNLVDFDMLYGHRNDVDGYAKALSEFDLWLGDFITKLKDDDLLIITADHGCDPDDNSTDHTREYIPLIVYGKTVASKNLGTRQTFCDVAATVADVLEVPFECDGKSLKKEILK